MGWTDIITSLPELALLATALVLLVLEVLPTPPRRWFGLLALGGVGVALGLALGFPADGQFYSGMIRVDRFTRYFDVCFLLIAGGAVLLSGPYLQRTLEERGEYYALILTATIGMMFMVKAHDLIVIFLGLELLSVSLYILVGFYRHRIRSNEAGLKYLLLGAFSSGFFLFGIALIYGSTASTHYDAIRLAIEQGKELSGQMTMAGFGLLLVGFAFKVALVPFHMYVPDVYEGSPTALTAFLGTGPKLAGFGALLKVVVVVFAVSRQQWWGVVWILAVLSMSVGNISALLQNNLKRMLAFSGVAHAGYAAIALLAGTEDGASGLHGASGLLFYLAGYAAVTLAAFGLVSLMEGDDESGLEVRGYRGLARRNPYLAAFFGLAMLSLAGFPPTIGFLGKYFIFNAALEAGQASLEAGHASEHRWLLALVVIAVVNTLISVYYYLRPVAAMYMHEPADKTALDMPRILVPVFIVMVAITVGLGLFPQALVKSSFAAAQSLF